MKFSKLRLLALAITGSAFLAAHKPVNAQCSDATLHGRYAFTITGQIVTPAPAAGPVSGVAMTDFDGQGNFTQLDHVLHNAQPPQEEWRPGSGPYHVNSDCTGYMILTPQPTVPADASPELRLEIVVGNEGTEIRTAVSGSPSVPPFTSTIISIGTRVSERTGISWQR